MAKKHRSKNYREPHNQANRGQAKSGPIGSEMSGLSYLQRQVGNRAIQRALAQRDGKSLSELAPDSKNLIQRRMERFPDPAWGTAPSSTSDSNVWFNPRAELWVDMQKVGESSFPAGQFDSFRVGPNTRGNLLIYVDMGWFQDNIVFNYSGRATVSVQTVFRVNAEGSLTWEEPMQAAGTGGDAAQLVIPVPVSKGTTPEGGYVQVNPTILASGSVSLAATPSFAPEGIGGSITGQETVSRTRAYQRVYRIDISVARPETPSPEMHVRFVSFSAGSDEIDEGEDQSLVQWYFGLPQAARTSIETGETRIVLEGHASTTQPTPDNRALSRRRAERVRQILQDVAGSLAQFQVFAYGEYRAATEDEVEDPEERRVEVWITYQPESTTTP